MSKKPARRHRRTKRLTHNLKTRVVRGVRVWY
jgi:hypothetical protein